MSNVEDLSFLFRNAKSFNKPLDEWNVCRVREMKHTFDGATSFDQNISSWNLTKRYSYGPYEFRNCPIKEENKPQILQKNIAQNLI